MPMQQVVRLSVSRIRPAILRSQVFEKLDARSRSGAQSGSSQPGAKDVVEPLLLDTVVFALAGDSQAQSVTVEPQAGFCIRNHDGGVIYSKKELSCCSAPFAIAL